MTVTQHDQICDYDVCVTVEFEITFLFSECVVGFVVAAVVVVEINLMTKYAILPEHPEMRHEVMIRKPVTTMMMITTMTTDNDNDDATTTITKTTTTTTITTTMTAITAITITTTTSTTRQE